MRNYRNAFVFTVVGNIALVGILGGLWWRSAQHKKTDVTMPSASDEGAQNAPNRSESASTAPHETSLVPVQLSPERLRNPQGQAVSPPLDARPHTAASQKCIYIEYTFRRLASRSSVDEATSSRR